MTGGGGAAAHTVRRRVMWAGQQLQLDTVPNEVNERERVPSFIL